MGIVRIIEQATSPDAAQVFKGYILSDADQKSLVDAGLEVLKSVPYSRSANACAHMTALWATKLSDIAPNLPVYVTAGNLSVAGRRVYYSTDSSEKLHAAFLASSLAYDGHFWLSLPGRIGDIALFRNAYSEAPGHWFRELITGMFGPGRGIYIAPVNREMQYEPKYVLSADEIAALVNATGILFGR